MKRPQKKDLEILRLDDLGTGRLGDVLALNDKAAKIVNFVHDFSIFLYFQPEAKSQMPAAKRHSSFTQIDWFKVKNVSAKS